MSVDGPNAQYTPQQPNMLRREKNTFKGAKKLAEKSRQTENHESSLKKKIGRSELIFLSFEEVDGMKRMVCDFTLKNMQHRQFYSEKEAQRFHDLITVPTPPFNSSHVPPRMPPLELLSILRPAEIAKLERINQTKVEYDRRMEVQMKRKVEQDNEMKIDNMKKRENIRKTFASTSIRKMERNNFVFPKESPVHQVKPKTFLLADISKTQLKTFSQKNYQKKSKFKIQQSLEKDNFINSRSGSKDNTQTGPVPSVHNIFIADLQNSSSSIGEKKQEKSEAEDKRIVKQKWVIRTKNGSRANSITRLNTSSSPSKTTDLLQVSISKLPSRRSPEFSIKEREVINRRFTNAACLAGQTRRGQGDIMQGLIDRDAFREKQIMGFRPSLLDQPSTLLSSPNILMK